MRGPKTLDRAVWGRPLVILAAVLFVVSSIFPLVAGLSKHTETFPKWWGPMDVCLALVLGVVVVLVLAIAEGHVSEPDERACYRAYRFLSHGLLVVCLLDMLAGDRIVAPNGFTGFASRAWLFIDALPACFALSRLSASPPHLQG